MRIGRIALWPSLGVLLALLAAGPPAAGAATRAYDSNIHGFSSPSSVGFDAGGRVWVSDAGHYEVDPKTGKQNLNGNGIYQYDPYPSQTLLTLPNTLSVWSFYSLALDLAVDQSNGEIFVGQANGRTVDIFEEDGEYSHTWSAINGTAGGGVAQQGIHVAVDNSNGYSRGRIYLSLTAPENDIEAVDAGQRPVPFPATASYIKENKLTGTPAGGFGEVQEVSVDSNGNVYVTDVANHVVDEFASTGLFVRTFSAPSASTGNPGAGGAAVDPTTGNVLVTESYYLSESNVGGLAEYDSSGNFLARLKDPNYIEPGFTAEGTPAVDASGRVYVPASSRVDIFGPAPAVPTVNYESVTEPTTTSGVVHATVEPNGGGNVLTCQFEYGTTMAYSGGTHPCQPGAPFAAATGVSATLTGLTTETTYHYRVVVTNANGTKYGADQTYTPHAVVGLRTAPASGITESGSTLNADLIGDGTPTHYLFEWGKTAAYGSASASAPGTSIGSPSGPGETPLTFAIGGLEPFTTYHYRVVATGGGGTSTGEDVTFTTTPGIPTVSSEFVSAVHSDRAVMHAQVNPNGADTTYHFEYVDDESFQQSGFADATKAPVPDPGVGMGKTFQSVTLSVDGLQPGTLYHYRLVGVNQIGTGVPSADRTFTTFPYAVNDTCPNAHVRQQTGATLLFDCRAYELASAANAGGYDVESDLVPGQSPYGGAPLAESPSQLLYGMHDGGIPGTGIPTNRGVDPYVATRGQDGWTTRYVGIPANNPFAGGPFSSTLGEADAGLTTFSFSGPDICSPCFADGSSGIPVQLPDGRLVQGMAGSLDPGSGAEPDGYVRRRLSGDGRHLIFGSTSKFEPDGNSNGDISIYDRDLLSGVTHVVSKTPGGSTMTGPGIGQLDVSSDGSRILFGQVVTTDSAGNRYWHLYMNVGDSSHSIDLTPGTTTGVLYDGMTSDGSKVFFSTADQLTGDDSDSSVDIYRADISSSSAQLTRISTGSLGTGNSDSCDPAANSVNAHWNSLEGVNCDAVAVGGTGGVASGDGTIYFLSPEALDVSNPQNQPVENAPNLYVARPGSAPHFIRTLESSANAPLPAAAHPLVRSFGSFGNGAGVSIDDSNGDIYVFDIGTGIGTGYVYKFDSAGHAILGFGNNGKLTVSGVIGFYNIPTQMGVDNDPSSANYRNLYVPDFQDGLVKMFNPAGAHVADISVSSPTAVAVNPSNGNVYVTEYSGAVRVFNQSGTPVTSFATIASPTGVAVDSSGNAYVVNGGGLLAASGSAEKYSSSGSDLGPLDEGPASGVAVDATDDHVFVDHGEEVLEYDSTGNRVNLPIGAGFISNSIGVAADAGVLEVTNRGTTNVASYGPAVIPGDPETDNPLVIDSVSSPSTRYTGDFEVSPSGDDAVFTSTLPLTGYENLGHREIYRYDAPSDRVDCSSCNPTGEPASGEASLPVNGLGLSDDGRVFFNSTEGLVDRDLNNRKDAYEWESGKGIELISTGTGPLASSLLGISADATDAYFFTRDTLVAGDDNGSRVKVYDARSLGGFPFVPAELPCKASDECHGAGSPTPPLPSVGSEAGTPIGNERTASKKCKVGGKCRRHKHRHKAKRHRRHGHRSASRGRR
jgi:hypothetical protein